MFKNPLIPPEFLCVFMYFYVHEIWYEKIVIIINFLYLRIKKVSRKKQSHENMYNLQVFF